MEEVVEAKRSRGVSEVSSRSRDACDKSSRGGKDSSRDRELRDREARRRERHKERDQRDRGKSSGEASTSHIKDHVSRSSRAFLGKGHFHCIECNLIFISERSEKLHRLAFSFVHLNFYQSHDKWK